VTIIVELFAGVVPNVVVTVIVVVPEPVTVVGLKVAFAPAGRPLGVGNDTTPLNGPDFVTVIVYVVLLPTTMVLDVGEAESEKSPAASANPATNPNRIRPTQIFEE